MHYIRFGNVSPGERRVFKDEAKNVKTKRPSKKKTKHKKLIKKKISYSRKLKDKRWAKKKNTILQRDDWTCQICGFKTHLVIHHKKYISGREPWEYKNKYLITLCEICHARLHGKMNSRENK